YQAPLLEHEEGRCGRRKGSEVRVRLRVRGEGAPIPVTGHSERRDSDLHEREGPRTVEPQEQDLQGVPREIWGRIVLSLCCSRSRLVYRQEAQALAQEAVREEADA